MMPQEMRRGQGIQWGESLRCLIWNDTGFPPWRRRQTMVKGVSLFNQADNKSHTSAFAERFCAWSNERKSAMWLRQPTTSLASEIVTGR